MENKPSGFLRVCISEGPKGEIGKDGKKKGTAGKKCHKEKREEKADGRGNDQKECAVRIHRRNRRLTTMSKETTETGNGETRKTREN